MEKNIEAGYPELKRQPSADHSVDENNSICDREAAEGDVFGRKRVMVASTNNIVSTSKDVPFLIPHRRASSVTLVPLDTHPLEGSGIVDGEPLVQSTNLANRRQDPSPQEMRRQAILVSLHSVEKVA